MTALVGQRRGRRGYSDLVLAGGVLVIMALMVLRLPAGLIDALVAVNVAAGLGLLLVAIYIPRPTAFNSFPSVLLMTTLFRLALSIATTRLILLDGDAGHIINAFGNFVAGGNLVVGLVVFVIITVVQFIVIAKGAERIAEVAARFTLDAMPGKQLSIDSDLRSGLIDQHEARRRRDQLEEESQLNGALDGAMKFVKGDAIAGIVIVIVNLVAGLAVGVAQRGMGFGEAAQLYSILTVGDGMVAQIPALLSAMAAGLVVTRASNDGDDRHLGEAIGRQLIGQPKALMVTGCLALMLATVPGFPTLIFLGLGALLLITAHCSAPQGLVGLIRGSGSSPSDADEPAESMGVAARFSSPLVVQVAPRLAPLAESLTGRAQIAAVIEALSVELGVPMPDPDVRPHGALAEARYRVLIFDVCVAEGELAGEETAPLTQTLEAVLRRHAARFLGLQEVSDLVDAAADRYPALVKDLMRVVAAQTLARVLRSLVNEGVPIRNLRDILEAVAEWGEREKDAGALTEFARIGLSDYLTRAHLSAEGVVQAIVLHPALEQHLRSALQQTPAGMRLSVTPDVAQEIRDNLRTLLETLASAGGDALRDVVLLTSVDIRRHVRELIRHDYDTLPVLSLQELRMPVDIVPLAQLTAETGATLTMESEAPHALSLPASTAA